jgi:hypothetical protein
MLEEDTSKRGKSRGSPRFYKIRKTTFDGSMQVNFFPTATDVKTIWEGSGTHTEGRRGSKPAERDEQDVAQGCQVVDFSCVSSEASYSISRSTSCSISRSIHEQNEQEDRPPIQPEQIEQEIEQTPEQKIEQEPDGDNSTISNGHNELSASHSSHSADFYPPPPARTNGVSPLDPMPVPVNSPAEALDTAEGVLRASASTGFASWTAYEVLGNARMGDGKCRQCGFGIGAKRIRYGGQEYVLHEDCVADYRAAQTKKSSPQEGFDQCQTTKPRR